MNTSEVPQITAKWSEIPSTCILFSRQQKRPTRSNRTKNAVCISLYFALLLLKSDSHEHFFIFFFSRKSTKRLELGRRSSRITHHYYPVNHHLPLLDHEISVLRRHAVFFGVVIHEHLFPLPAPKSPVAFFMLLIFEPQKLQQPKS